METRNSTSPETKGTLVGNKQIRIGQLITPFGPGSIYTDRRGTPLLICGLDNWFKKYDPARGWVPCNDPTEFERFEPRLAELLKVDRFRIPPDYRVPQRGQDTPNANLTIPSARFPRWYRHSRTGTLKRFRLDTRMIDRPADGGRWLPVRFVSVCADGHLSDFPWKEWIGCNCAGDGTLRLTDRGGSELTSIRIQCDTCPDGSTGRKGKSLSGTTVRPEEGEPSAFLRQGIACSGSRSLIWQ